jgi:hypothetical protein
MLGAPGLRIYPALHDISDGADAIRRLRRYIEAALWSRALLQDCRGEAASTEWTRVVIGIDPPASA